MIVRRFRIPGLVASRSWNGPLGVCLIAVGIGFAVGFAWGLVAGGAFLVTAAALEGR